MNATRNVTMTTLTTSQCEELMNAVYRILSQTGIEVRSETARKIFAENGCTVKGKWLKSLKNSWKKQLKRFLEKSHYTTDWEILLLN